MKSASEKFDQENQQLMMTMQPVNENTTDVQLEE